MSPKPVCASLGELQYINQGCSNTPNTRGGTWLIKWLNNIFPSLVAIIYVQWIGAIMSISHQNSAWPLFGRPSPPKSSGQLKWFFHLKSSHVDPARGVTFVACRSQGAAWKVPHRVLSHRRKCEAKGLLWEDPSNCKTCSFHLRQHWISCAHPSFSCC